MELVEHIKITRVNGVKLLQRARDSKIIVDGSLSIDVFFLIFSSKNPSSEETDVLTFLHTSIHYIDHKPPSLVVSLCLKDFRTFDFEFQQPEHCQAVVASLQPLSKPAVHQLYAFSYMPRQKPTSSSNFSLWQYDLPATWRVSTVNKDFKICDSYPAEVVVPSTVTDEVLKKVAVFRHFGRFPVLCYHHRKNQGVLLRCGQPLCGPGQKRSVDDSNMLNACLMSGRRGQVLDVRAQSTASHHIGKGGGTELPNQYSRWKLVYADMESSGTVIASLEKLMSVCSDRTISSNWFGKLESSGWLEHVHKLLSAVQLVVNWIDTDGTSVVVHGASGRDVTLVVTSLAQLLLDPQNRTIEGFIRLVQREWLDAGYPFSSCHGSDRSPKERSPLFLLFLDAVWQITQQYPLSFEFSDLFLHKLFTHSYFSPYGTFLYDSPFERIKNRLYEKTYSLWSYLMQPEVMASLVNPYYSINNSVLSISTDIFLITLWEWAYVRGSSSTEAPPPAPEHAAINTLQQTHKKLLNEAAEVRRELEKLQAEGREMLDSLVTRHDQPAGV